MAHQSQTSDFGEVEYSVPSMMCDGCAEKIRIALSAVSGVCNVKTKLWRKRVQVRYDRNTLKEDQIKEALGSAGFVTADL